MKTIKHFNGKKTTVKTMTVKHVRAYKAAVNPTKHKISTSMKWEE